MNCQTISPWERHLAWLILAIAVVFALSGCAHAPAMPRVVKVPVPVTCQIEQVPPAVMPNVAKGANVFELTVNALARLKLLEAENARLRAANANPCPAT